MNIILEHYKPGCSLLVVYGAFYNVTMEVVKPLKTLTVKPANLTSSLGDTIAALSPLIRGAEASIYKYLPIDNKKRQVILNTLHCDCRRQGGDDERQYFGWRKPKWPTTPRRDQLTPPEFRKLAKIH